MGNLLVYSGITTKIRAMRSRLLSEKDFEEISALHNVPEVVAYLKKHSAYADDFAQIDENKLHRGDVEKILVQSLYDDYSRLYRFSGIEVRKFMKLYLKRYEVDLINYCLRIIFNHYEQPFDLNYKRSFFDRYSQISIEKLITSRTIEEFVDNLQGTEYYEPLRKLRDSNASTLFDYDLALDLYYYTTLWKEKKKVLKKRELEIFTRDIGSKIDLLNLQWIYRAKKYFKMQPADIYSMIIPIHFKIHRDTVKELVETASVEEFIAHVASTYYVKRYDFDDHHTIERVYFECIQRLYTVDERRNPYSIASINTYLFLKEEEIKRLTSTLECIRYGLTPKETLDYTGGVIQK